MRTYLTIIVLLLSFNLADAQACGVYRVKYKGFFKSASLVIKNIKLPNTHYFHSYEEIDSDFSSVKFDTTESEFEFIMMSHLTSAGYQVDRLIEVYKEHRKKIPVSLAATNSLGQEILVNLDIPFDRVVFGKPESGSGYALIIDLGEIEVSL